MTRYDRLLAVVEEYTDEDMIEMGLDSVASHMPEQGETFEAVLEAVNFDLRHEKQPEVSDLPRYAVLVLSDSGYFGGDDYARLVEDPEVMILEILEKGWGRADQIEVYDLDTGRRMQVNIAAKGWDVSVE